MPGTSAGFSRYAESPLLARAEIDAGRQVGVHARQDGDVEIADLVGEHRVHGLGFEDARTADFTVTEQRPLEPEVVERCGVQRVPSRPELGLLVPVIR
jgi:hypothetical protein